MQLLKYPVKVILVTIKDNSDANNIKEELSKHGKVIGDVFREGNNIKGGAFLWKHKVILGRDEFILVIIARVPAISEGAISKRGLFNLKKFAEDYKIPIIDIGTSVDASEIVKAIKKSKPKKIKLISGSSTRRLNLGVIITEDDEDFKKIYEQLGKQAGESNNRKELWAGKFNKEDTGLIIWHHEMAGKDNYWIFLVLDEDTIREGNFIDLEGPDIKKFKEQYENILPIIKIPRHGLLKTESSTIIKRLKEKLRKIKESKKN